MFVSVPVQRRPSHRWAVPLLFVALWLAFVWARMQPDEARRSLWLGWGALSRGLADPATWWASLRDGSALRLFTSLFLHADWAHLLGNLVFLLIFGAVSIPNGYRLLMDIGLLVSIPALAWAPVRASFRERALLAGLCLLATLYWWWQREANQITQQPVEHELHGDLRPPRPVGVGRGAAVADQVARVVIVGHDFSEIEETSYNTGQTVECGFPNSRHHSDVMNKTKHHRVRPELPGQPAPVPARASGEP